MTKDELKKYKEVALEDGLWNILYVCYDNDNLFSKKIIELRKELGFDSVAHAFEHLNRSKELHCTKMSPSEVASLKDEYDSGWVNELKKMPKTSKRKYVVIDVKRNRGTVWNQKAKKYLPGDVYYVVKKYDEYSANYFAYLTWAKELHNYHNVPIDSFGFDDSIAQKIENKGFDYIDLKFKNRVEDQDTFYDKYKNIFKDLVDSLSDRLLVNDFQESYRSKHSKLHKYYEANFFLYQALETKLEHNRDLHYLRVFTPTIRKEPLNDDDDLDRLLRRFLKDCSFAIFIHVCSSLHKGLFKNREATVKGLPVGFYIQNRASKTNQFSVLDYYTINEHYRYTYGKAAVPDYIVVRQAHLKDSQYDTILNEFKIIFDLDRNVRDEFGEQAALKEIDKPFHINSLSQIERTLKYMTTKHEGVYLYQEQYLQNCRKKLDMLRRIKKGYTIDYRVEWSLWQKTKLG